MTTEVTAREASFHDAWATGVDADLVDVRAAFEATTAPENRFILSLLGDLAGKRVLDVGSGLGESSVYFALRGARVTAADLSPKMVDLARELARRHGTSIEGVVCPAEELAVPAASFDVVYLGNILHHVPRALRPRVFGNLARALAPGGRFFSWDPISYNPAIKVYRRMATKVRTEDEDPLTFGDVATARASFPDARHREFWILTLSLFLKYYLVDRVHPNADRYWKKILKEPEAGLGWFRALQHADGVLTRIPLVRRLSWNMVMWGTRA
ncbi:MAG: class I SAM-dependent methyltransferase [Acidobacteriota bacterium]